MEPNFRAEGSLWTKPEKEARVHLKGGVDQEVAETAGRSQAPGKIVR
jgi:hypothetical protein